MILPLKRPRSLAQKKAYNSKRNWIKKPMPRYGLSTRRLPNSMRMRHWSEISSKKPLIGMIWRRRRELPRRWKRYRMRGSIWIRQSRYGQSVLLLAARDLKSTATVFKKQVLLVSTVPGRRLQCHA